MSAYYRPTFGSILQDTLVGVLYGSWRILRYLFIAACCCP